MRECKGHPTTIGAIGSVVYCDGSCIPKGSNDMSTEKSVTWKACFATMEEYSACKYLGILTPQEDEDHFEIIYDKSNRRLIFGGACNVGFLESGYMDMTDDESLDEALMELSEELDCYYRDGKQYCTRIVCNECM